MIFCKKKNRIVSFIEGQFQEVAVWIEEDAVALFGLNTSKAPALLPGSGDVLTGSTTDSSYVNRILLRRFRNLIRIFLVMLLQQKNFMKCFQQVNISRLIYFV